MSRFTYNEVLPGVYHIRDAMGVYMTLIAGCDRALLIDCGYGLEDVSALVRTLTDKPFDVMLTHAHHDHAIGAMWFESTRMFAQDSETFAIYTGQAQRKQIAAQAQKKSVPVPDTYLTTEIPLPLPLEEGTYDLGGLTADIHLCPGHTPGSAIIYVPERKLLLTGDDWNPCTWLFFPEALGAHAYRKNVCSLLALPFMYVLCPHREALYPRAAFEEFVSGLTSDVLHAARRVDMGWPLDTREAIPAPGQQFVFDFGKLDGDVTEE